MTAAELTAFLPPLSFPFCYDTGYAVPTTHWLFGAFLPQWKAERQARGLWPYTRRNDCDNFARACCVAAQDAWAQSAEAASDDEGLAVGEFCYTRRDGQRHAIVAAITEAGLIFIEPQTCERIALLDEEINSCFRAAF